MISRICLNLSIRFTLFIFILSHLHMMQCLMAKWKMHLTSLMAACHMWNFPQCIAKSIACRYVAHNVFKWGERRITFLILAKTRNTLFIYFLYCKNIFMNQICYHKFGTFPRAYQYFYWSVVAMRSNINEMIPKLMQH